LRSILENLVISFSGNNWDRRPTHFRIPEVDTVLLEQGIPGMNKLVESELAQHVVGLVGSSHRSTRMSNVPWSDYSGINLADCASDNQRPVSDRRP